METPSLIGIVLGIPLALLIHTIFKVFIEERVVAMKTGLTERSKEAQKKNEENLKLLVSSPMLFVLRVLSKFSLSLYLSLSSMMIGGLLLLTAYTFLNFLPPEYTKRLHYSASLLISSGLSILVVSPLALMQVAVETSKDSRLFMVLTGQSMIDASINKIGALEERSKSLGLKFESLEESSTELEQQLAFAKGQVAGLNIAVEQFRDLKTISDDGPGEDRPNAENH